MPRVIDNVEANPVVGQDARQGVIAPSDRVEPAVGHGDGKRKQVVDGRTPEHGGFAAGVFGDIAADGAGPGAGGIRGKHQALLPGNGHGRLGDHTGFQVNHRNLPATAVRRRHLTGLDAVNAVELFRIDDHAAVCKGNAAAGKPRAPASGNYLEPGPGKGPDHRRHLCLTGGAHHGQRQAQAPVGGVGYVGVEGKGIGENLVPADDGCQASADQTLGVTDPADAGIGFIQQTQAVVHHRPRCQWYRLQCHLEIPANGLEKPLVAPG